VEKWRKYFDLFIVERQKLENANFFLFLQISFSKICIRCDMKVFNLSVIQQYALKVAQNVCFFKR